MQRPEPRIPPVGAPKDLEGEARELLERTAQDGEIANVFKTLARHPKLFKRWMVFANHVLFKSTLPPREREILILRAAWLSRSSYEWGQHAGIGMRTGLSAEEIRRIGEGPDAPGWEGLDRVLLRAADELHREQVISDETWKELSAHYRTEQLMDVVFTFGQYTLLAMALNTFGVQLDDGLEGFPE